jgi:hypothetical protein
VSLTKKLLNILHKVFDIDPGEFLALRIHYSGAGLTWSISDNTLSTRVSGGSGQNLTIDLTSLTIRQLVNFISSQPGYSVPGAASGDQMGLSARVLMDGSGDIAQSNGDHLYAYTDLTWVYMSAFASELKIAKAQIPQAISQMSITSASDDWLDELGGYYGVKRQQGELDYSYGPRIIAEVVRPRCNNVAMEQAISYYTGQSTKVTDVTVYGALFPLYNGAITRNSEYNYQVGATPKYGLFDVQFGYDLLGGTDQTVFAARIRTIIERIRAAGTHLRSLSLQAGIVSDSFAAPTDGAISFVVSPGLADTATAPTETLGSVAALASLTDMASTGVDAITNTISFNYKYNSLRKYNSKILRQGGTVAVESS